ncbi:hypothetical protein HYT57_02590 [Candidatus Woesearchaeota archaeon]|nr:hypothetical protein [Candidatus Woesearchaeota archaeon]
MRRTFYVNVLSIYGGKKWQQDEGVQPKRQQVQLLEEKLPEEEQQKGKG